MLPEINFNLLFSGYQDTPNLWSDELETLHQFGLPKTNSPYKAPKPIPRLRLGKWVEQFAKHQIDSDPSCKLIAESLQIRKEKQTIGELDFLFKFKSQLIHLEVVYKFYLYNHTKSYKTDLEHWIGPNRTDSLMLKLDKLKTKQLPLLHHPTTRDYLDSLKVKSDECLQKVQFKAQLFVPLKHLDLDIGDLNKRCISGFYLNLNDINLFKDFEIYLPTKLEWLAQPHNNVNWGSFDNALKTIEDQCQSHRSPMIWLKDPEHNVQKAFVTWW
ncbi:MAG: DUF1853 family protein [Bacteroidota bacterium]